MKHTVSGSPISLDDATLADSVKLLSEIQAAIHTRDLNVVRQKADLLKGAITSVLAKAAFEAASRLESTFDENELAHAREACQRLEGAILSLHATVLEEPAGKA